MTYFRTRCAARSAARSVVLAGNYRLDRGQTEAFFPLEHQRDGRNASSWLNVTMLMIAAMLIGLASSTSRGELLVHDNFNRSDGNLVGTDPTPGPGETWAAHSGANGPVQITGGEIRIVQDASSRFAEDVNVPVGRAMQAGETWYAAFDVTVEQPGASIVDVYFAHFLLGTSSFTSRLWVTAPVSSGYRMVLTNRNVMADGAFSQDLVLGQTYRVVVSYNRSAMSGQLWIDPIDQSSPAITPTDTGFDNAVTAFAFRQGSPSALLTTEQTIDNLCVATTFEEALSCAPSQDLQVVSAAATPSTVRAGAETLLTVEVTAGTPPYSVTGNLTAIGGASNQAFFDDGTNGDETPGDNVFSFLATVPCSNPLDDFALPVSVTDSASGSVNSSINLTVIDGTTTILRDPSDATVCAGETARFNLFARGASLQYQWHDSSGPLSDGGNISGANEETLVISNVQASDAAAGPYFCVITGNCAPFSLQSDSATLSIGSPAGAHEKQIVINQVYGGGGNSGATYSHDFIELFNNSTTGTAVDVTGWSVQYASSGDGVGANFETPPRITVLSGIIQPGHSFLIQQAQGPGGSQLLPTPDIAVPEEDAINIGSSAGKVVLANVSTPLSGSCPHSDGLSPDACNVVDFVGWGDGVTCAEGGNPAPGTGNTTSVIRKSACVDTDDNGADFTTIVTFLPGNPRNHSSSPDPIIAVHPASYGACEGEEVTFTILATGPCLEYQWWVNTGSGWSMISGANEPSYTTPPVTLADEGTQYRCDVWNDFGGPVQESNVATLSVGVKEADRAVVISQVYGSGGNQDATYTHDFVELYNQGPIPIDLDGWSVQYAAFQGVNWQRTDLSGTIGAGQYFLVRQAAGSGCAGLPCGDPLPSFDASGSINMSGTRGKIALLKSTATLEQGISCPPQIDCRVVDFVGYGTDTDCFLGAAPAPYVTNNAMAARRTPLCANTPDNEQDFLFTLVNPKGISGDLNRDGYVDSGPGSDLEIFAACATGSSVPYDPNDLPPGCTLAPDIDGIIEADLDRDGDVDMDDFAIWQGCFSGTGVPANPACACP